jgi:hypothetical protein
MVHSISAEAEIQGMSMGTSAGFYCSLLFLWLEPIFHASHSVQRIQTHIFAFIRKVIKEIRAPVPTIHGVQNLRFFPWPF